MSLKHWGMMLRSPWSSGKRLFGNVSIYCVRRGTEGPCSSQYDCTRSPAVEQETALRGKKKTSYELKWDPPRAKGVWTQVAVGLPHHCRRSLQHLPPTRLGIAFAYYGVILASAELLERDLVCGSAAPPVRDSSHESEESRSPCHCRLFSPDAYQTMIISTVGEIARNLPSPPCPAIRFSQPAHTCCKAFSFGDVPGVTHVLSVARLKLFT